MSSSSVSSSPSSSGSPAFVEQRRYAIRQALGGVLPDAPPSPHRALSDRERNHLFGEARDLYVNEVEWERLTDEEEMESGPLVELAFPGLLAFVRGLLLREAMPDSLAPADPRPEVVEDVLSYLEERITQLAFDSEDEDDSADREWESGLARRLVDLILYRLHGLSKEDVARLEAEL